MSRNHALDRKLPVILVQGLGCHPCVLGPLSKRIARALGRPTLSLTPWLGLGDVRDAALGLLDAIDAAASRDGFDRIDIVGHSMGGLVATYLLKCLDHGRRIRRVIALGTPFRGALAATLASLLGPFGGSLGQVAPGSRLLRLLTAAPVPSGSALVSISGSSDRLVPPEAARIGAAPGHHDLETVSCGHMQLLFGARAFSRIRHGLAAQGLEALEPARLRPAA